jgi:hypothetical protein
MHEAEYDALRTSYLRYASAAAHNSAEKQASEFWAFEAVFDLVIRDPETTWRLVTDLVRLTSDEAVLAYVAAGPLEGLLVRHGPSFIDRIEAAATEDRGMMRTVTGVWGHESMDERVGQRLCDLVRGQPPF